MKGKRGLKMRRSKRRNFFIDRRFQSAFIVKFCVLIILVGLAIGVLIYALNRNTTTVAFENLRVVVKSTSDFILPMMVESLVIVTVLAALVTIAITLFASHKISGPLYRLNDELEKVKSGDLSGPVRIRTGDQLQKVADTLEGARLKTRERINRIACEWEGLKNALAPPDETTKKEGENGALAEKIEKMDEALSGFKLK